MLIRPLIVESVGFITTIVVAQVPPIANCGKTIVPGLAVEPAGETGIVLNSIPEKRNPTTETGAVL